MTLPIQAILFDMDGTLVDSEQQTDEAILRFMQARGVDSAHLSPDKTRGRTWDDIARDLIAKYRLDDRSDGVARALADEWAQSVASMTPIPGAQKAVKAASKFFRVGIVSSSPRDLIDRVLKHAGLDDLFPAACRVGGDDVRQPKPAPEGLLRGASYLAAPATACLVFEDSQAGLRAAEAAQMRSIVVLHACAEPHVCRGLAQGSIRDFHSLPDDFWQQVSRGKVELAARDWT